MDRFVSILFLILVIFFWSIPIRANAQDRGSDWRVHKAVFESIRPARIIFVTSLTVVKVKQITIVKLLKSFLSHFDTNDNRYINCGTTSQLRRGINRKLRITITERPSEVFRLKT